MQNTLCPEKNQNVFRNVFYKTWAIPIRWNLVHSFLNQFAASSYKRFPPHQNNVSTLPSETWSAHRARATTALLGKVTKIYPTSTVASKFATFESRWLQRVGLLALREKVYKTRITDVQTYRRRHWRMAAEMTTSSSWATPFSVAVSVCPDQWWVF